jgi:hypothetical protein
MTLQRQVEEFNLRVPVGTPVECLRRGVWGKHAVLAPACVVGKRAICWLVGVSGMVALDEIVLLEGVSGVDR